MTEPVRRLPDPEVSADGKLVAKSTLTPEAVKTRGAIAVHSRNIIPVIVVPGIMGSNLRATTNKSNPQNELLDPGQPAWRPPNGIRAGLTEAKTWKTRSPKQRQQILDGETLEVDPSGKVEVPDDSSGVSMEQLTNRWWGELHWDSYGGLLSALHSNLSSTFENSVIFGRTPNDHWESIIEFDREEWAADEMPPLTEAELEKFSKFHYPVYACGYNWILSNEISAERLKQRITDIIEFWNVKKFNCKQVILITHSMGGLVARACAKQIPEKIVGIVHGVMPALGAPLAYRRIACGTETSSPSKNMIGNTAMEKFAEIAGDTSDKTTPTMATACGALELLPNHLYPRPWLIAAARKTNGETVDISHLQSENPYDLYRDFKSWFRLIDPALADPAKKYQSEQGGDAKVAIHHAIAQAEKFHTKLLHTYYHPNTYAYYGADSDELSFGVVRWITNDQYVLEKEVAIMVPAGVPTSATTFNGGAYMYSASTFHCQGQIDVFHSGPTGRCW